MKLLAEARALLPQAGLDPDLAEAIEGDFRVAVVRGPGVNDLARPEA